MTRRGTEGDIYLKHGEGKYKSKDGIKFEGNFKNDSPVTGKFYIPTNNGEKDTLEPEST